MKFYQVCAYIVLLVAMLACQMEKNQATQTATSEDTFGVDSIENKAAELEKLLSKRYGGYAGATFNKQGNLEGIFLRNLSIHDIPEELRRFKDLERITISNTKDLSDRLSSDSVAIYMRGFPDLSYYPKLKVFSISGANFPDTLEIPSHKALIFLGIHHCKIKSLRFLAEMPKLEIIYLEYNHLVSPFDESLFLHKNLESVTLSNNQIEDITLDLSQLPKLEKFELDNNPIRSLDRLEKKYPHILFHWVEIPINAREPERYKPEIVR